MGSSLCILYSLMNHKKAASWVGTWHLECFAMLLQVEMKWVEEEEEATYRSRGLRRGR